MTTSLCFNDITLSPVTHQNSLWIRAAELARALGYSSENLVSRLYTRNADEFTPDMTQTIEISAEDHFGSVGRMRIFSLRGCHLIAMFARTPVAKEFRRWVLDVLDRLAAEERAAHSATELPPAPQSITPSTPADRAPLRALVHAWATVSGVHHAALWPQVKAHFQLARIDDLPLEWLPDALAFAQGKIDQHRKLHVLPSSPDVPALPRGKRAPGPVERQIMALSVEIDEAFGGLRTQLGDVMRRLRNVVRPLYGPTYDALGWHSHAGFSVDSLAGTLSQGHWDSLRHVDDALADARNYAMVFKTLARLHGM